jgi:hypothetical protein
MQKITIDNKDYSILDAREFMTIPDCFVSKNKIGRGHGEAKFYVGNENEETLGFFGDFTGRCIMLKSDLQKYLEDAKIEYTKPAQQYRKKSEMPGRWTNYKNAVDGLQNEVVPFSITRSAITPPRVYINSKSEIYKLLRKIALPQISYLSALKLKSTDGKIIYYFRPFIDYHYFGEKDHPSVIAQEEKDLKQNTSIGVLEKEQITKARIGQGKFRESLIDEFHACIITGVADERILNASHIKPWVDSDNKEKIDPKNGLIFTPTYDRLFDMGFISFEEDGSILVSPWLSPMNQKRLFLRPGKKYVFDIAGRKNYLQYHRDNIFKK